MSMHASLCTCALMILSKDDHESAKSKTTHALLLAGKSMSSSWTRRRVVTRVCLSQWWWYHSLVLEKQMFLMMWEKKIPVSNKYKMRPKWKLIMWSTAKTCQILAPSQWNGLLLCAGVILVVVFAKPNLYWCQITTTDQSLDLNICPFYQTEHLFQSVFY